MGHNISLVKNKRIFKRFSQLFRHSFIRFATVGLGGTVTNLSIFFVFADILKLWVNGVAVTAFLVAGTQNYALHHKWSFREITGGEKLSFRGWVKFNLTTFVGLGINLIVLNLILHFFDVPYKVIAQFCGVAFGTVFNYLGSRLFVFKKIAS